MQGGVLVNRNLQRIGTAVAASFQPPSGPPTAASHKSHMPLLHSRQFSSFRLHRPIRPSFPFIGFPPHRCVISIPATVRSPHNVNNTMWTPGFHDAHMPPLQCDLFFACGPCVPVNDHHRMSRNLPVLHFASTRTRLLFVPSIMCNWNAVDVLTGPRLVRPALLVNSHYCFPGILN